MEKQNRFSDQLSSKPSAHLLSLLENSQFTSQAKLAAIWELDKREELPDEMRFMEAQLLKEQESPRSESQYQSMDKYRTFWRRFGAGIVDGFALMPISFVLGTLMSLDVVFLYFSLNMLNHLAPYIYSILMHGTYGQTLGKMATGIKIVDAYDEGNITMKQAILRDIVPLGLMLSMYFYTVVNYALGYMADLSDFEQLLTASIPALIIGFTSIAWFLLEVLTMLTNEKSRAVHDFIAGTVVVKID